MQVVIFTGITYGGFGRYAGTYRVASELRQAGFEVQVVEFFTTWDHSELLDIIDKFIDKDTKLVGFSCTFFLPKAAGNWGGRSKVRELIRGSRFHSTGGEDSNSKKFGDERNIPKDNPGTGNVLFGRDDIFDILEYIKSKGNNKIVVGGHRSYLAEDPPFSPVIDFVLSGQSDVSIRYLANHVVYGDDIKVSYEKNGCQIIQEKEYPVNDFPTTRIQYHDNDIIFPGEILPIELARGCIFKCAFCSYDLLGKKVWEFNRDPELVSADLIDAHNKFGSTGFMFCDDTYNDSVDKVERLHEQFVKLPFDMTFSTYARADMLITKPHTIALLQESGMRSVFFGIETLNHRSGKAVGKGMDPEKIKDGLYAAKASPGWKDIVTSSGFIIGLPYDTEDTIQATFEWLLRDDCPLDSFSCSPLSINPISSIGKNMAKYGYKWDENGNWYSEWMTEARAKELAREYMYKTGVKARTRFQFTYFGRMQNIGWTLEDFDNFRYTNDESDKRVNKLQDKYYVNMMNL